MIYYCIRRSVLLYFLVTYSEICCVAGEPPLTVEVTEEAPVGTLIHGVAEYLNQFTRNLVNAGQKESTYQLLGDDVISHLLHLHSQLGQLRVSARIDREAICPVEATDTAFPRLLDSEKLGRSASATLGIVSPYSTESLTIKECIRPLNILMVTGLKDSTKSSTSEVASQTTRIRLNLIIRDINDNAPTWPFHSGLQLSFVESPGLETAWPTHSRHSQVSIPLEESGFKYAKTIDRAIDPDLGINGTLSYRLIGPGAEYFRLDDGSSDGENERIGHRLGIMDSSPLIGGRAYSGFKLTQPILRIWPVVPLDRETDEYTGRNGVFNLTLLANDLGVPSKTGSINLVILVTDVNDNTPIFQNDVYGPGIGQIGFTGTEKHLVIYRPSSGHIRETMPVGGFVVQLNATDKDSGVHAEITYDFCPCDRNIAWKYFSIDQHTGRITVASKLDYDSGPRQFFFKVIAKDGAPEPYTLTGTAAVEVMVSDENDETPEIRVMLVDASRSIDGLTQSPSAHSKPVYSGIPSESLVHGAKFMGEYITAINENPRPETVVAYIQVFDLDQQGQDQVYCRLGPSDNFTLQVDSVENKYSPSQLAYAAAEPIATATQRQDFRLVTGAEIMHIPGTYEPLDRETTPIQRVTLTCTDSVGNAAFVHIQVHLKDLNDQAPHFPKNGHFVFQLPENQELNGDKPVWLGRVAATDRDEGENAVITYRLSEEITWSDANRQYIEGGIERLFELDTQTGDLFAKSIFDRESSPPDGLYRLRVYAVDKGQPVMTGTANVDVYILDVNDWAPQFSKDVYTFIVSEDTRVQEVVGVVEAVDRDANSQGRITYHLVTHSNIQQTINYRIHRAIISPERKEHFPESSTEDIISNTRAKRDTERKLSDVIDGPLNAGDNPVQSVMAVPNRLLMDTRQDVQKADHNELSQSALPQNYFSVDRLSGKIRLIRRLDREVTAFYTLEIMATDAPPLALPSSKHMTTGLYGNHSSAVKVTEKSLSSTTRVVIAVSDVNDNSPVFRNPNTSTSIQLRLQETLGRQLLVVEATDSDEGDNGRVSYFIRSEIPRPPGGPGTGYFAVDDASGILFLARVLNSTVSHRLVIEACDNGVASSRRCTPSPSIRITVLDGMSDQDNAELALYQARSFAQAGQVDLLSFDLDNLAARSAVVQTGRRNEVVVVCLVIVFSVLLLATIVLILCLVRRRGQSQSCIFGRSSCVEASEKDMKEAKQKRSSNGRPVNDLWIQEGSGPQGEKYDEAFEQKSDGCKIAQYLANISQNESNYHMRERILSGVVCPVSTALYSPGHRSIHTAPGPYDPTTLGQFTPIRRTTINDHQISFFHNTGNSQDGGTAQNIHSNSVMNPLLARSTYQPPSPDYQSLDAQWHHFPVTDIDELNRVQLYRNPLATNDSNLSYSVPQRNLPEKPAEPEAAIFLKDSMNDVQLTSIQPMYYEIPESGDVWNSPKHRPSSRKQHIDGASSLNYNRIATLGRQNARKGKPHNKQKEDSMFHCTAGELALHSGKRAENTSETVGEGEDHVHCMGAEDDSKSTGNYTYQAYREGTFV